MRYAGKSWPLNLLRKLGGEEACAKYYIYGASDLMHWEAHRLWDDRKRNVKFRPDRLNSLEATFSKDVKLAQFLRRAFARRDEQRARSRKNA